MTFLRRPEDVLKTSVSAGFMVQFFEPNTNSRLKFEVLPEE